MRIVFMGTPDFAVPVLAALAEAGHEIIACYSQPARPAGRGKALQPTPVARAAEQLGVAVHTPLTLRDAAEQARFAALGADVAVVAAYGLILPRAVLAAPRLACMNVHASLLPRWRGAAPVQRAILAGDDETGVCIMQMEAGLDTGPVRLAVRTGVAGKTAGALMAELGAMGAAAMVRVLADVDAHPAVAQPDQGITYAAKIDKAEARIDWHQGADAIERQVRAFNPAPGAWFSVGEERVKLLAADVVPGGGAPGTVLDDALTIATGAGAIRPILVQRAGRAAMTPAELLRGFALPPGTRL
ncbi:methionyl-tRNA formyltransferase [Sphingomonas sp.]|uniref:methionyl-tRNA formyltransferase n=1 Tax=Sphingomonas sp. TaxID=28214 RepID=UPI001D91BD5A|nr:methionyl-tRNA formyltransferase [Sphingomonas sp.]MBX9795613.1 methionyl-tRNA formyltransferase [Sphingomonas sp.]